MLTQLKSTHGSALPSNVIPNEVYGYILGPDSGRKMQQRSDGMDG